MISELRRAFEIGFLLFVPFLVIDMVVAAILMSMGMMMLPPVTISLPFKIIFFVLVDGWYLVAGALERSYVTGGRKEASRRREQCFHRHRAADRGTEDCGHTCGAAQGRNVLVRRKNRRGHGARGRGGRRGALRDREACACCGRTWRGRLTMSKANEAEKKFDSLAGPEKAAVVLLARGEERKSVVWGKRVSVRVE